MQPARRLRKLQRRPRCVYCGVRMYRTTLPARHTDVTVRTRDHLLPVCEGGTTTVPACLGCNAMRGNENLVIWYRRNDRPKRSDKVVPLHALLSVVTTWEREQIMRGSNEKDEGGSDGSDS